MTQDEAKRLVAKRAAELVRDGMVVGLGTGTTATKFIHELAARKLKIRCVASSDASHELGLKLGMDVRTLAELPELDVYIDGADEVCVAGDGLDLIKGGGGALLREKIVASAAKEFIVVADSTKLVKVLGKFPLPVELIQMALPLVEPKLAALGFTPKLRMAKSVPQGLKPSAASASENAKAEALAYPEAKGKQGAADSEASEAQPFITDEGNYILDCWSSGIAEPESTAAEIRSIIGVVEHGLFLGMASLALVAGEHGVVEYRAQWATLHRGAGTGRQMDMDNSMESAHKEKVWFITGASTGFGRLLAEEVLKAGGRVIATARKAEQIAELERRYPQTARAFLLDVTHPAQIEAVATKAVGTFGRIDVLVNNAGYGIAGGIEEASEAEFLPVFETNVFGLMRVTRAFLPQFRAQRSGHILNLSSMAGLAGSAGWGYYNASKFAVEGFSEALAQEMAPLGVHVTIVEPGPFRTDFLGRSGVVAKREIADYAETVGKTREYFYSNAGKQRGDPMKAVQAMMDVVESPDPPLHLILGAMAYNRFKGKLEKWHEEMVKYESVTLGADFPEGQ